MVMHSCFNVLDVESSGRESCFESFIIVACSGIEFNDCAVAGSPMSRNYDLHCHSDQSDGILSPEALVSRAKANDVSVLALTDHDTIAGLARARSEALKHGIELVNGIEFSCQWQGRNVHIVGLAFDTKAAALVHVVEEQTRAREDRAREIGERLTKIGFERMYEAAAALAAGGSVGRPHFAKAMVAADYVSSIDVAFRKYLGAGKPGDVRQHWPTMDEIVPVICESKGIAVLAHPLKYKMTRTKLTQMIADFVDCGGKGIEVVSGVQRPSDTRDMCRLATKFDLLASTGSDFHAPNMRWAELGAASAMPENVVEPVWSFWEQEGAHN